MTADPVSLFPHADPVLDAGGVRALDHELEGAGLLDLAMEAAGAAVAGAALSHFGPRRVLLLAGGGANGGDAYVAARHLIARGAQAELLSLPLRHPLTRANRARLRAVGGGMGALTAASLTRALRRADLVVDGLLGTGFAPPMRSGLAALVEQVNASGLPVLSIDLPSGLDAGLAERPEVAVRAALTVTFGGAKPALIYGPAAEHAGTVQVAGVGAPLAWTRRHALALRPADADVAAALPRRAPDAHKGVAGRVWIIGGHPGTVGAPVLSALGALKAGAGLVTLYSSAAGVLSLAVETAPELMARELDSGRGGAPDLSAPDLSALSEQVNSGHGPDALALGMGLGPQAAELARRALAWKRPTVLDADALQPELAGAGHDRVVWTPHPGEAARLLGVKTPEIVRDPVSAARTLQQRFGGVVVLKGGPTTIAAGEGVFISRGGHPGMASAGMGDTLSGILASLLGQGLEPLQAAVCGVRLHARAGELAGARHGYGLTATDVSGELGAAWLALTAG